MQYVKKDLGSYQLHLIQTTAFKSILVKMHFHNTIQKEKITARNFLVNLLLCSTAKTPSKREISIRCQDLYAAQISATNRRIGSLMDTCFTLSVLQDRYTQTGNFRKSLELFHEILLEPNVENKAFCAKDFEMVRNELETRLKTSKEDLSHYSIVRALEKVDSKSPLSIRGEGYLEDIKNITQESLYEAYQTMIQKDKIDIFVIGDIEVEEVMKDITEIFQFKTYKGKKETAILPDPVLPKRVRSAVETVEAAQTKLVMVCRLCNLTEYERNYPLTLYNIILGGSADSLLFTEVREKNSLCYSIRSVPNKLDNCLLIMAGIPKDGKKQAIKAIQNQLKTLVHGDFMEEALCKAKEFYLASFDAIEDSMGRLAESYYMMELLGVDDIETKKQKMREVTKEQVVAVAKKVKLDLIYTLEGGSHEETTIE